MAKELKQLTKRADDYSQWFNDLVVKADLAEQAPVRGCMIIKPYGYAIWEKMQKILDDKGIYQGYKCQKNADLQLFDVHLVNIGKKSN